MSSISFTSIYAVGQQVVFYSPPQYTSSIFVVIGTVQDIIYDSVANLVYYHITTPGGLRKDVPEASVFAVTDTFQRLIDLVTP